MATLSLLSQKGGCGKTTIAVNLAVQAHLAGYATTIIDIDPQTSAAKWGDRRNAVPTVKTVPAERLARILAEAEAVERRYRQDLFIVDTAGKASGEGLAACRMADLILIPCRPTIEDIETVPTTWDIVTLAKKTDRAFVVLNATSKGAMDSRLREARDLLGSMGVNVAPHAVGQRVLYADAMIPGMGVSEMDPNSMAAYEMQTLFSWASAKLGLDIPYAMKKKKAPL